MVKKLLAVILIVVLVFLAFRYCEFKDDDSQTTIDETALIQEEIKNVGKLIVTEGHFSEVLTYKDQQKYFMDMVSFEKKAIVIVNADVTVAYDLSKIEYDINEAAKTITIKNIPKEEVKINPDIKFYDMQQSQLNEFSGEDYNKINKRARESITKKIANSALTTNAQNRLLSELSKILILTNTMGWKLQYNGTQIDAETLNTLL